MTLRLPPTRVFSFLVVCVAVLLALHFVAVALGFRLRDNPYAFSFIHLDNENSVGTWFAEVVLLAVAALLGMIGAAKYKARDGWYRHWIVLALVALYASVDEGSRLHEQTSDVIRRSRWLAEAVPGPAWVVAGTALVVVMLVVYARFLMHLPRRTRYLFLLGAAATISGAIGTESVGVEFASARSTHSYGFQTLVALEELLETLGVCVLIYALLDYVRAYVPPLVVTSREASPDASPPCSSRPPEPR